MIIQLLHRDKATNNLCRDEKQSVSRDARSLMKKPRTARITRNTPAADYPTNVIRVIRAIRGFLLLTFGKKAPKVR